MISVNDLETGILEELKALSFDLVALETDGSQRRPYAIPLNVVRTVIHETHTPVLVQSILAE